MCVCVRVHVQEGRKRTMGMLTRGPVLPVRALKALDQPSTMGVAPWRLPVMSLCSLNPACQRYLPSRPKSHLQDLSEGTSETHLSLISRLTLGIIVLLLRKSVAREPFFSVPRSQFPILNSGFSRSPIEFFP